VEAHPKVSLVQDREDVADIGIERVRRGGIEVDRGLSMSTEIGRTTR